MRRAARNSARVGNEIGDLRRFLPSGLRPGAESHADERNFGFGQRVEIGQIGVAVAIGGEAPEAVDIIDAHRPHRPAVVDDFAILEPQQPFRARHSAEQEGRL